MPANLKKNNFLKDVNMKYANLNSDFADDLSSVFYEVINQLFDGLDQF